MSTYVQFGKYHFEVVEHRPLGYEVWNISSDITPGYLPFCRLKSIQPFEGGRAIETDTLKVMKCDDAKAILDAIGYGPETPAEMAAYIEAHKKDEPTICTRMERALAPFTEVWNR